MNEEDARTWLSARVPRETFFRLERFATLLIEEAANQNLLSASSIPHIWVRHIVDSAQLLEHAPAEGCWLDVGSGAGLPGMIVGIIGPHPMILVEPRARRVTFLRDAADKLGLTDKIAVEQSRAETLSTSPFDIVSARAVAPLDRLLSSAQHLSNAKTRWILPKGRSARQELDVARETWQGNFELVPSITDPDASIIVASKVRPRTSIQESGSRR